MRVISYIKTDEPLTNIDYFKTVKVNSDIDTIVWENEADFSPDFLYEVGESYISSQAA